MASDDIANLGIAVHTGGLTKGEKALDKYAATGEKTERRTLKSSKSMASSYATIGGAVASVVSALKGMEKVVGITREFDKLNSQLITATGGAKNAAVAFGAIQNFAATTPYDLAQATEGFTKLVNLGLTPSEAALTSYGNTASAMGKDLSQMVEAVADATVGEFERLKEFGIKSKTQGENVSFTFQGVTKTVKKEASAIEGYLSDIGKNQFAGTMAVRAATADGALSNLGDTWDGLFLTVSKKGVGDLIKDTAIVAAESIQILNDDIASGSLAANFDALFHRFDNYVNDVSTSFNIMSAIIGESTNGWGMSIDGFIDNSITVLKKLPEMMRFFIQLTAVNLAALVDYGKQYGDAFVDVLSVRFQRMVDRSAWYMAKIASVVNPFADAIDLQAALKIVDSSYKSSEDKIIELVQNRVNAITIARESTINGFALEAVAAEDAYKERIKLSNQLIKQYKKEKSENKGDVLVQFGMGAGDDSGVSGAIKNYQKWIEKIEKTNKKMSGLKEEIKKVNEAMSSGRLKKAPGLEYLKKLEGKVKSLKKIMSGAGLFGDITDSIKESLGAVQDLSAQGSKSYAKLGAAIQLVTVAQKVQAIATAATMATVTGGISAALALVGMLGSLGSELKDDSAANQAKQGLSIWGEKSESISKSIDITASATDKLVGINTGMLKALQNMQAGIAAAAGLSAQGAKGANFTYQPDVKSNALDFITDNSAVKLFGSNIITEVFDAFSGNFIFKAIGKLLGGSSKVTDSGIKILGGTLSSMTEGASVFAFQDVKSKKHRWSHTKRNEELQALDDASKQFAMVFDSLADSVYEGATALGLSGDEVTNAINKFQIETTKISLKGLDIDEQQKEIEAVFSKVFNDLAGFVTMETKDINDGFKNAISKPKSWLEDFRKTGEELGETLARLAGEVAIADFSVKNLGIELGDKLANPKLYAEIADNLSTLTGGIESFAEKTASFVEDFAPDSVKLSIATDSLTESLNSVGLTVPDTAEGFWELMTTLKGVSDFEAPDLTSLSAEESALAIKQYTDSMNANQAQIAAMLNSQDVAKEYFKLLKDGDSELNSFNKSLMSLSNSLTSAVKSIYGISSASASASLDAAISAARIGDFSKALNIDVSSFKLDQSSFSSLADFNFAQAEVANRMTELADLTGSQASVEDMMLTESQKQTELLTSINSNYVPQKTASDNNVIMLEEIKALRSEISRGNDMQQESAKNTKDSADHLETLTVFGVEVRK